MLTMQEEEESSCDCEIDSKSYFPRFTRLGTVLGALGRMDTNSFVAYYHMINNNGRLMLLR